MTLTIENARKVKNNGRETSFFTLVVNIPDGEDTIKVKIYGCTVMNGKNGKFISFPSRKGNDNKWYNYAHINLTEDEEKSVIEEVEKVTNKESKERKGRR